MTTIILTRLLQIGGTLYFGLLCAGALMPRAVNLRTHIAVLPPFIRHLFWVYYSFIGLCLVSFGLITIAFAETLASGSNLARALCLFFASFWLVRLVSAQFIFDVRPYLTKNFWRLGYHATNILLAYLPVVYVLATWEGGSL